MKSSRSGGGSSATGPCGACKFLRRKCVKGCVFAAYFEADDVGTAQFAAVHRVFGASNASKLLLRLPPHCRLEAVVTLCYEALSRLRDPVYGCVAHIFTLQQQVVNLQAELAYTQARLSTLQRLPHQLPTNTSTTTTNTRLRSPPQHDDDHLDVVPVDTINIISLSSSSTTTTAASFSLDSSLQAQHSHQVLLDDDLEEAAAAATSLPGNLTDVEDGVELQTLMQEFVSKYFSGVKFRPLD